MRWVWCAVLALGCEATDVPDVRRQLPEIAVAPDAVAFGEQVVPFEGRTEVQVSNAGRAPLEVTASLTADDVGAFALAAQDEGGTFAFTVPTGESLALALLFEPPTYLDYTAQLVLTSNDEDTPELVLDVTGTGIAAPLPDLVVRPSAIDFGDVDATTTELLFLENVGGAPLHLGDLSLAGSSAFSLLTDPSGNTLAPGDDTVVVVQYAPTPSMDTGPAPGDRAVLTVPSDDPGEREDDGTYDVDVELLGNGGDDYPYPVAILDCPPTTDPPRQVTLDARRSDAMGRGPLTYAWTLRSVPTDPSGAPISAATLASAVGDTNVLSVDAAGEYVVELVVTNVDGISGAADRCTIDAIPDEDILVELTWSDSSADLDLHLARDGAAIFARPDDVNWCNPTPIWDGGATDGRLDIDDRTGFGPENINVPAPADGDYVVRVHYFDAPQDPTVTATVRVYLEGALDSTWSKNLTRNEVWDVGTIRWPQSTFGPAGTEPATTSRRQCFTP